MDQGDWNTEKEYNYESNLSTIVRFFFFRERFYNYMYDLLFKEKNPPLAGW